MSDKILKLSQAQTLYSDLRGRIDALPTNEDIPEVPVQDVQVNSVSVLNQGVANVPVADGTTLGVVKADGVNQGIGIYPDGTLALQTTTVDSYKAGGTWIRPVMINHQHTATFYGLAKAAGDTTQKTSSNPVGTYTDEAKAAIRTMLGAISSDDYAIMGGSSGVVKLVSGSGLTLNGDTGALEIRNAYNAEIKTGTNNKFAITPAFQATSVFYGLAKAAGDTTQIASSNAVGTYTDEAKATINTMLGSVSKVSLDNAGITSKTYSVKFGGQFTVTTAENSDYISPYVRASVTGRISKHYKHRVTFDGMEYILDTGLWFTSDRQKTYEYLGNLGLYVEDVSGVPQAIDNVPFVIISDLNDNSSIDVLTSVAGTHTIKVEQITPTQTKLPNSLLYGDEYAPIQKKNNGGTYNGFSIGVNELKATRGTIAFGYFNRINHEWGYAFGDNNTLDYGGIAIGDRNQISNHTGYAFGYGNIISGANAIGIGDEVTANTNNMIAFGSHNVPGVIINKTWASNTYYKRGEIVKAVWAPPGVSSGPEFVWICKIAHTSGTYFMTDQQDGAYWELSASNGDTLFVIGNGSNVTNSNALKIDLIGNTYIGGNLYVNCNSDSTGGTLVPTDIQVNGTSVVSNGVANIPVAGNSLGVVKVSNTYGLTMGGTNSQFIQIHGAPSSDVKNGTHTTRPIVPVRQHEAVFYGLAKVAGADEKDSTLAVGTYSDTAKAAIRSMIGATNGDVIAIQDTQPTANDVKLWLPETMPEAVDVPTMDDLEDYVKKTDIATASALGVVAISDGLSISNTGFVRTNKADLSQIKNASSNYRPVVPASQHAATFYGLAKAAGADMASSDNAIGTYTDAAKSAICSMIGAIKTTDIANSTTPGIMKVTTGGLGLVINSDNILQVSPADTATIKAGTQGYRPITAGKQHESVFYGLTKAAGVDMASSDNAVGTYTDTAKSAIRNMIGAISDVQINGTSITTNGVANIPIMTSSTAGVAIVGNGLYQANNKICVNFGNIIHAKQGNLTGAVLPISECYSMAFYGLAKAAGADEKDSTLPVGTYTAAAKSAIQSMLGIDTGVIEETIYGTDVSITAEANCRYICDTVSTISITPCVTGSCEVIFTSGSSVAILTAPNTVKWPEWFDPTALQANTIYDILITHGTLGAVMSWTA